MADEGTSSTLVLVGAVLQLIFFFVLAGMTALFAMVYAVLPTIPLSALPPGTPPIAEFMTVMMGIMISTAIMTVFALVFTIVWFMWRGNPSQHKVGLILTGILGLVFSGFLPGLLALIGGAIASKKSTYIPAPTPTKKEVAPLKSTEGVKYCSACGNPVADPNAQFCGVCGASII